MKIKAKIDIWISLLIWIVILIIIVSTLLVPKESRLMVFLLGVPVNLFLLWIYLGTYYVLKKDYLLCKSGPFVEKIHYDKIKSLRLCKNMLSSMALSRDRIEIKQHGKGYISGTTYISPINRTEFIQELMKRCKNLSDPNNDQV